MLSILFPEVTSSKLRKLVENSFCFYSFLLKRDFVIWMHFEMWAVSFGVTIWSGYLLAGHPRSWPRTLENWRAYFHFDRRMGFCPLDAWISETSAVFCRSYVKFWKLFIKIWKRTLAIGKNCNSFLSNVQYRVNGKRMLLKGSMCYPA